MTSLLVHLWISNLRRFVTNFKWFHHLRRLHFTGAIINNKSTACSTMLICQGPSFYLKLLVKKGHNSKNIAFRVMLLVLQQHLVMMSKYFQGWWSDTFNTFWVKSYITVLMMMTSSDHKNSTFCSKQII